MMDFDAFSQAMQQRSQVNAVLTRIQTHHGLNANFILYAIWHAQNQRGRLHKQSIKILLQNIHPWHERILIALQRLIQCIKVTTTQAIAIKNAIEIEIHAAESIERRLITESLLKYHYHKRNSAQQLSDACHNIINYYHYSHVHMDEDDKKAITTLLHAAFPHLIISEINEVCENPLTHSPTQHDIYSQLSLEEFS